MGDTQTANVPTPPDPAAEAQAIALIRLLEADGCILHGEWYPEPGVARLKYTRRSEDHDQMWVIDVRPWAGWVPHGRRAHMEESMDDTTDQVAAAQTDPGPYSIGSDHWPGLAKAAEECGEMIQVAGKVIAAGGASQHWDGSDLRTRLEDEAADVIAAAKFLVNANGLDKGRIAERINSKQALFERWHQERKDGSLNRDAS